MAILAVDDSKESRVLIKMILTKAGYEDIVLAESAEEAFKLLEIDRPANFSSKVDLILMDILMPEMDGIEACRNIKLNKFLCDIPVIMVTGAEDSVNLQQAFEAGAMDYINKPVNKVELLTRVGSALKLKKEMDQRSDLTHCLEKINQQLSKEIEERKLAEEALKKAHHDLELRVQERTRALSKANERLKEQVAERKRVEENIREAHGENEQLIAAIPSILIGLDPNNRVAKWNSAAEKTLGVSAKEAIGKPLNEIDANWDMGEVLKRMDLCRIKKEPVTGKDISFRDIKGKNGFLLMTVTPVFKNAEEWNGFLLLTENITKRKTLEVQLAQALKLESIGQLAAGIAHEINTPTQYVGDNLSFIKKSFADIKNLLDKYAELLTAVKADNLPGNLVKEIEKLNKDADVKYLSEETPKAISQSLEGIEQISSIVMAMKEFSHPGTEEKVLLDINKAVESTVAVARNEWKYAADIVTDFDNQLPHILCLPGELNQAILNIIINAAHAIKDAIGDESNDKGVITIRTRRDNNFIEIQIKDTGTGIPENVRSRVFDPFFTTKEVGKGTGQGLAIAHSVITDKHGGMISFETEMEKGTTFIIRLPIKNNNA